MFRQSTHSLLKGYSLSLFSKNVQKTQKKHLHIEKRLEELGITLPAPPPPRANYDICCYTPGVTHDKEIMYVSGHLPILNDGTLLTGCVGPESGGKTVEEGREAARQAALNLISTLKNELGDLDRVDQVVKVCYNLKLYESCKYKSDQLFVF